MRKGSHGRRDRPWDGREGALRAPDEAYRPVQGVRACLTSPRARLGGIFSALTALKILAIRQDSAQAHRAPVQNNRA